MIEYERLRGVNVPVGASGIRGRVNLLGREVREVNDPVHGLVTRGVKRRAREQPDRQVGTRPLEVERVEVPIVQPSRRSAQCLCALAPGGDRIGRVEPADVRDLFPQPVERLLGRQLRIDEPRPRLGGARDHRPVRRPVGDHVEDLLDEGQLVPARPVRIEVVEQADGRRPGQ